MNPNPSLVILTGNQRRHIYFTSELARVFVVLGIAHEAHKPLPVSEGVGDDEVISKHSRERDEKEAEYFKDHTSFSMLGVDTYAVESGEINSDALAKWVIAKNPDYLILYGTGIVKDPLLSHFGDRVINMHLGLSPYYRGAATNFWPLVFGEPECVGATIHLAILKVDAGAILGQARPDITSTDTSSHDIGCKAIIAGTAAMIRCIKEYREGKRAPQVQQPGGKVFRVKDFNADAVRTMWKNFEEGMVADYLAHKKERNSKFPIVEV